MFLDKWEKKNLEKAFLAHSHGGPEPRKFMATLYLNVFVNYFIRIFR